MKLTKKQQEARRNYIGASEVHHVINAAPWGCMRYLCYDKRGVKPDYERPENHHIERGTMLEPIVKKLLKKRYGIEVEKVSPQIHAKYDFLRASPDGMLGTKLIEIKCPSKDTFIRYKRNGLPEAYILQLQMGMECCDVKQGMFAIFNADLWELLTFDVFYDEDLIQHVIENCQAFWQLKNSQDAEPDRLTDKDKRCTDCIYRKTCRGQDWESQCNEMGFGDFTDLSGNADLQTHIDNYKQYMDVKDESEILIKIERDAIVKILESARTGKAICNGIKIYNEPQSRITCDKKLCQKEVPEIFSKYAEKSWTQPLRIF